MVRWPSVPRHAVNRSIQSEATGKQGDLSSRAEAEFFPHSSQNAAGCPASGRLASGAVLKRAEP
jgi:hypothetical protein